MGHREGCSWQEIKDINKRQILVDTLYDNHGKASLF